MRCRPRADKPERVRAERHITAIAATVLAFCGLAERRTWRKCRKVPAQFAYHGCCRLFRPQWSFFMNLSLVDAFGRFGAKPINRLRGQSAIAADGALVLSCSVAGFGHPSQGVLRYQGTLPKDDADAAIVSTLGQHLTLARDGNLPVRMVVMTSSVNASTSKTTRSFHVRPDLIGKLVSFDGDSYTIDFTRVSTPA